MKKAKLATATPILIIAVGTGWLLTARDILPGVNWAWVLGLGFVGVLVMGVGGIDKLTIVVGPFLILSTIFSLLRQTDRISEDTEIPCLVIMAGVLMLISRLSPLPPPEWLDG